MKYIKLVFFLLVLNSCNFSGSGGGSGTRYVDTADEVGPDDVDLESECQGCIDDCMYETDRLESKISELETITNELESEMSYLRSEVDDLSHDDLDTKISNIESKLSDVESLMFKLKNEF
jgi:hypothetical protein